MEKQLPIPFEEIENKVCEKGIFHLRCSDCIFMVLCNLEHEEERYRRKMEERKNKTKNDNTSRIIESPTQKEDV